MEAAAALAREGGGAAPAPHEPISFGIDQILSGPEPPGGAGPAGGGAERGGTGPAPRKGRWRFLHGGGTG